MPEIAKAYVQIVPSAEGIKGSIEEVMGGEADAAGKSAGSGFSKAFGGAISTVGKVAATALAAGAAAAGALVKEAIGEFADYEQLVGGVETLFKGNADTVQKYAANAYKSAGLSANQYMETVTSFSASLLQSLDGDTAKAAEVADMAITDMADNANKMGTSIESIQTAYQGFAKQNYTMLDNLKLGYGGTKEEMARLLEDATKLSGVEYDINSLNDVYNAIHVIQDSLGVTGTTAKEASETISGSLAATKAAWSNLIVSVASDNTDFDASIQQFTESAATAVQNILPRIETALNGVGELIEGLAPVIIDALPPMLANVLPGFIDAAVSIVMALVDTIAENIDLFIDSAIEIILTLADALVNNIEKIISATVKIITAILTKLTEPETVMKLIGAALDIIVAIGRGLVEALPELAKSLAKVLENIIETISTWWSTLVDNGKQIISHIADGIAEAAKSAVDWGRDLIDNFIQGIKDRVAGLIDTVAGIASDIADYLGFSEPELGPLSNFHTFAPDMMALFAQGIRDNEHLITDQITKSFDIGARIVNVGTMTAASAQSAQQAEPQSVRNDTPAATYMATINLDGNQLWSGILPYKQESDALLGVSMAQ